VGGGSTVGGEAGPEGGGAIRGRPSDGGEARGEDRRMKEEGIGHRVEEKGVARYP
jgi:hypothetical protein